MKELKKVELEELVSEIKELQVKAFAKVSEYNATHNGAEEILSVRMSAGGSFSTPAVLINFEGILPGMVQSNEPPDEDGYVFYYKQENNVEFGACKKWKI